MGFDVTFHPVAARELQRFVFDVLDDRTIVDARLTELTRDDDVRGRLRWMFDQTFAAIDRGPDADDEDNGDDEDKFNRPPADAIRFLAAIVAGCLHPYWVTRGAALSLARAEVDVPETFQPLARIGTGRIQTIPDDFGAEAFYENYMATGFMQPADVKSLSRRLPGDAKLNAALGEWGVEALGTALRYAAERGIGLIEATDLFTMAGSMSDPRNLRVRSSPPPPKPIECPACGVINTPGSTHCDCGHDLSAPAPAKSSHGELRWIIPIVLGVVAAALRAC